MSERIEVPDITGFGCVMQSIIEGSSVSESMKDDQVRMVNEFVDNYRKLDQARITAKMTRTYAAGEPCMHGSIPCVVISVSSTRVFVRQWRSLAADCGEPAKSQARGISPYNLSKVSTPSVWRTWCGAMAICGHDPANWIPSDLQAAE